MKKSSVLKLSKGQYGKAKNCYRIAKPMVQKGLQYAYRDRKNKKREFRGVFIQQINAGCRLNGLAYSQFIHGLVLNNIQINRKILADLAVNEPYSFESIVNHVQKTTKTRNTEQERLTILPEKLKFVPMDWKTFKAQIELDDQLEKVVLTSNEQNMLDTYFEKAISEAKEQNIKDLKEGKFYVWEPHFKLNEEQKKYYDIPGPIIRPKKIHQSNPIQDGPNKKKI